MVQTVHLIRHGHHALLDRVLCGRTCGVGLDELGRRQMAASGDLLRPAPGTIQSSPQERTLQSAEILAQRFNLPVEIAAAVDEIDMGDWSSLTFDELDREKDWARWNAHRGTSRPPNGESMKSLQKRIVEHLDRLRRSRTETVAIVSHAEPIRAALLHYAGIPLDDFACIEVAPASVSTLTAHGNGFHISRINQRSSA